MYNTSFYYSTSSTSAFDIDGTTRSYTDNATALTYLTDAIKEKQSCQHGAITETKGVIIMQDYGYNHTAGINSYLANKIKELNQSRTKITSIAMTNSGYYCVTYEKNGYYGYMPGDMSTKMKEFNNNGETIYCVSISENGAYVIVTDKHFVASNSTDNTNMKKASDKYGTIKDVCITNLGICIICSQGVYYRNIPTNVEEKIKSCKVKPDHIRFTDSGTFLITYENGNNYKYYM